ncbi:MAG TPA: hypothetical protein VLX91_12755 [Candidatus Acidoferrales bacterium]|nr:hypothetical protein [Candidatus Acidoferrales bacterium]
MPKQIGKWIRVLVVFLVFYCFILGLLLAVGLPSQYVDAMKFLKEGLILILVFLAALCARRFENRGFNLLDWLVLSLWLVCTIYLLRFSPAQVPNVAKLNEYRIYIYVCIAYWIGRYSSISPDEMIRLVKFISFIALVSAIVSVLNLAVFDYAFSNIADLYRMNHTFSAEYGNDVLSLQGLEQTWGGGFYLRIWDLNGSYLDLGNYLVFASCSFLCFFYFSRRRKYLYLSIVCMIILLLTGARAAAATMLLIGLGVVAVRLKKPFLAFGILGIGVVVVATVQTVQDAFVMAVGNALDLSDRAGHIGGWYFMIQSFIANPYGYGFGVGERTASIFGTSRYLTGFDSNPAHFIGNMGFLGGALWLATEIVLLITVNRVRKSDPRIDVRIVAFAAFFIGLNYFLISLTKYIDTSYDVAFPFWILVGWVSARSNFIWNPEGSMVVTRDVVTIPQFGK